MVFYDRRNIYIRTNNIKPDDRDEISCKLHDKDAYISDTSYGGYIESSSPQKIVLRKSVFISGG